MVAHGWAVARVSLRAWPAPPWERPRDGVRALEAWGARSVPAAGDLMPLVCPPVLRRAVARGGGNFEWRRPDGRQSDSHHDLAQFFQLPVSLVLFRLSNEKARSRFPASARYRPAACHRGRTA